MGLTAIVSSAASASSASASSASATVASLTSPVGLGVCGVFVAAAPILLLSHYDVLDAADESIRMTLVASIVPLAIAFAGVVLFQTFAFL
jgi:hypothetical protein